MRSVLVVDDDAQIRATLRQLLEREGYDVWESGDGEAAYGTYLAHRPDVVVLDIVMPLKEGLETLMDLRKFDRNVRVIAISGASDEQVNYLAWASALGASAVLRKPFSKKQLLDAIAALPFTNAE